VIDGQKIWTTFGHYSSWMYVLCRTDPDAPKHKGLSFLLVPLDQPGIEVRPIRTLAGNADFSEVHFDRARTDADLVVGGAGEGWSVAMGLLGIERGATLLTHQLGFRRELDAVVELARACGRSDDALVRDRLAQAWIELRLVQLRNEGMARRLVGGAELGPEVSLSKIAAARWHQRLGELQMSLLGPAATVLRDGYEDLEPPQKTFLLSRAETIYGGSTEIQRNIVAERLLGLPR
jgi:alkylation response protein AidB-like acyl-CoA dehydrogenase